MRGLVILSVILCASTQALAQDVDPLDLPVLPPNHPARLEAPKRGSLPEPPLQALPPNSEAPPTFFGESIVLERGSLVYVLDFSSSMGVFGERIDYQTTISRWDVVVRETRRSVSALAHSVEFNLVVFGTGRGCGVVAWRQAPRKASDGNKAAALVWLAQYQDALSYGGATPTGPAVVLALTFEPEVILLLTDGQPSPCGLADFPPRSHRKLIRKENAGTRIDVFGIGLPTQHAYEFSRGVASDNGGVFVDLH